MARRTGRSRVTPRRGTGAVVIQLADETDGVYWRAVARPPGGGPQQTLGDVQGPFPDRASARSSYTHAVANLRSRGWTVSVPPARDDEEVG